ncbi:MAG: branched-chain amino acid ABC transporter substrate-binding protein [Candidatus Tectimicrobiota bacterium]|nr:MAG: branched-chain amino acid ABC transporter substrate-binding protein [Candidatus Tectomicrobia bacterium]
MKTRHVLWVLVLLVAVALSGPTQAAEPIKIGAAISLTGKYGRTGEYQLEGYQLWVKQVNERGGLLGRPVELIVLDDKSDPATSVKLYEKLITVDQVDLVLAPYSSAVTYAVAPVTEKYGYPMLAAGASSTKIWEQGYRYIFMMVSPAEVYLEGAVDIAARNGLKTVAMLAENSLFPKASAAGTKKLLQARGMELVFYEEYPKTVTDFSAVMLKLQQLRPEVVLANTYFPDAVIITRQMKEYNVSPKLYAATVGPALPDFYESLGKTAEYVYGPSQWDIKLKTPGNAEFVKAYTELHGRPPDYHSASGYASCVMLEMAVKQVGSLDRDKIRDALARLDTTTVFGDYAVDEQGKQLKHKMVLLQWQDGQLEIVWPDELATAPPRFPTPPWEQRG